MREHDDEPIPAWVEQPLTPDAPRVPTQAEREAEREQQIEEIAEKLLNREVLTDDEREWLRERGPSFKELADRVRDEEGFRQGAIDDWSSKGHGRDRKHVLRVLNRGRGQTTYDELEEAGVARRTAEMAIRELKELDLIETRGNPSTIVVTDPVDRVLIATIVKRD